MNQATSELVETSGKPGPCYRTTAIPGRCHGAETSLLLEQIKDLLVQHVKGNLLLPWSTQNVLSLDHEELSNRPHLAKMY